MYDPAALKAAGVPNIDPTRVSAWVDYPLTRRDLKPVMNGVAWQPAYLPVMAKVPAQEIGDLYYVYLGNYRDQLVDYYIEATDSRGNVTRSEIQSVYVGAGTVHPRRAASTSRTSTAPCRARTRSSSWTPPRPPRLRALRRPR